MNDLIDNWKKKYFPPLPHDKNWLKFKWHVCQAGEPKNPIANCKGGEIYVERYGIIGWLYKTEDKTFPEKKQFFYVCPLIESRESGTGKFNDWLVNVKKFVKEKFNSELALSHITNEHLYKYCQRYGVSVAVDQRLYSVKVEPQD